MKHLDSVPPSAAHATALSTAIATAFTAALFLAPPTAHAADTTQQFSANIAGKTWESDNDGLLLIFPTKGVFNINAVTKGASAYPPPKTPVDRLHIMCTGYAGKAAKFGPAEFTSRRCYATFQRGTKPYGKAPDAEFTTDGAANSLEITAVRGKVLEGRFSFEMKDKATGERISIKDGKFLVEDRQL